MNCGEGGGAELSSLTSVIRQKYPLFDQLRFALGERPDEARPLMPLVGVLTSMMEPGIEGDTCMVVPVRDQVAIYAAVMAALSAAREAVPELLDKYVREGFQNGERVRVLPSGHVYEFGGFIETSGAKFFNLKFIDDPTNGSRSFPLDEAVRLEKTTYLQPLGRGQPFGDPTFSPLDRIIGTRTAGNHALLRNEVTLISTQKNFIELANNLYVCRAESSDEIYSLSDVLPWGTITPDGEIAFKGSKAAAGQPIIAVSPRAEYVAAACADTGNKPPRVIIDGASRVKDLQAFDSIVHLSKMLLVADRSDAGLLAEIEKRDCEIWALPPGMHDIVPRSNGGLLGSLSRGYAVASRFSADIVPCASRTLDCLAEGVFRASDLLGQDTQDADTRLVGRAISRLLELSSIVHDPPEAELEEMRRRIDQDLAVLAERRIWIPPIAFDLLELGFKGARLCMEHEHHKYREPKQNALGEVLSKLRGSNKSAAVVSPGEIGVRSAKQCLQEMGFPHVPCISAREISASDLFDHVIVTAWLKSRNFERLLNASPAFQLTALACDFEARWFDGALRRYRSLGKKWIGDSQSFGRLTGMPPSVFRPAAIVDGDEPGVDPDFDSAQVEKIEALEERIRKARKGSPPVPMEPDHVREARYISFRGRAYAYLTESYKVPCITRLVRDNTPEQRQAPLLTVDNLQKGDLILFRHSAESDRDMIRLIAERSAPPGEYEATRELADTWKEWLRAIHLPPHYLHKRLTDAGIKITEQAVRGWLTDPDRIGPGREAVFRAVAALAPIPQDSLTVDTVWAAIQAVRGSHIQAGFRLSQLLLTHLPGQLPALQDEETFVDLTLGEIPIGQVVIVEVESIERDPQERSYLEVNVLHFDDD